MNERLQKASRNTRDAFDFYSKAPSGGCNSRTVQSVMFAHEELTGLRCEDKMK